MASKTIKKSNSQPSSVNTNPKTTSTAKPKSTGIQNWMVLGLITLVVFIIYFPALKFGFTGLDDKLYFMDNNAYFVQFSNFFKGFWESCVMDYYRPMLWGTFMIDAQFGAADPFWFHFNNLVYHIIACYLMFLLMLKFDLDKTLAMYSAIIYAAHPVFSMAVAWVPGRNDPLLAVFILAAFISFINYYNTSSWRSYFVNVFMVLMCLCTKETGGFLPIVVGSYIVLFKTDKIFSPNTWKLAIGYIIIAVPYFLIRKNALYLADKNGIRFSNLIITWDAFVFNLPLIPESIGKLFVPINLSVFPTFSAISTYTGLGVMVFIVLLLLISRYNNWKLSIFTFIWFTCFIISTMLFLFDDNGRYHYLEHRIYLPGMILIFLVNDYMRFLKTKGYLQNVKIIRYVSIGIIVIMSALTLKHSSVFKDPKSYWTASLEQSVNVAMPYKGLGNYYLEKNDLAKAEEIFDKYHAANPTDLKVINALGEYFESKNDLARAERYFLRAVTKAPTFADYKTDLGRLYEKTNRIDKAEAIYREAIAQDTNCIDGYFGLGVLMFKKPDYPYAEMCWKKVVSKNPNYVNAYTNLAVLYYYQQRYGEALGEMDKLRAIGQDPATLNPELNRTLEAYRQQVSNSQLQMPGGIPQSKP